MGQRRQQLEEKNEMTTTQEEAHYWESRITKLEAQIEEGK